jgi:hypothetical protein
LSAQALQGDGKIPTPEVGRWTILALLGIALLMVVLDVTVVNVALRSAQQALVFGNDQRQWIVTPYTLAFGSMLLLGGKLGDLFGRKSTFIAGLIGRPGWHRLRPRRVRPSYWAWRRWGRHCQHGGLHAGAARPFTESRAGTHPG